MHESNRELSSNNINISTSETESREIYNDSQEPSNIRRLSNNNSIQLPLSELREASDNSQALPSSHYTQMPVLDLRSYIESVGHQVAFCPHVFIDSNSCKGYLHKMRATFQGWAKRWFVFDRSKRTFMYFSDESQKKVKGVSFFHEIEGVFLDYEIVPRNGKPPGCIFIVKTKDRSYTLHAESPAAARIWINVIITGNIDNNTRT